MHNKSAYEMSDAQISCTSYFRSVQHVLLINRFLAPIAKRTRNSKHRAVVYVISKNIQTAE